MQMEAYFKNKSVALIGNAQSIFLKHLGSQIDAHDVVVRLNFGVRIIDATHQGRRTDVWVIHHSFIPRQLQVKFPDLHLPNCMIICGKLIHDNETVRAINSRHGLPTSFELIDPSRLAQLSDALNGAVPSTGLIALDLIASMPVRQLNLFGFDWKMTKTWYHDEETPKHGLGHSWHEERSLVQERYIDALGVGLF